MRDDICTVIKHQYASYVRAGVPECAAILRAKAVLRLYLIDQRRRLDAQKKERKNEKN